jgi:WD40 repeat protein
VGQRLALIAMASGRVVWQRRYPVRPFQQEVSVAFTPRGTLVTSASHGETFLWDTQAGRIKRRFPIGGPFALSPDGHSVALAQNNTNPADPNSSLALLDLRTGRHRSLPPVPAQAWIISVAFTPDGKRIVSASFDGALRLWDAASGAILETFGGHSSGVNQAVSPDGRTLLSESGSGSVAAWDLSGSQRLGKTFRWGAPDSGCAVAPCFVLNAQSTVMATNQADGAVALIDLRTRRVIGRLPSNHGAAANALAFLADGRRLATGDATGRVAIWDVRTRHILRAVRFRDPVWWVAVSPDSKLLVAQTQAEGTPGSSVEVRELASGRALYSKAVPHGPGGLSFSVDGDLLATLGCCEQGSRIEVWDSRSGTSRYRPRVPGIARSIAFSPDGRYLGAGTAGGRVVLFDAGDGHRMGASFQAAAGAVNPISFSPDGRLLAVSGEDGTATLWDLESRKRLGESFPIPQAVIPVARFSGNGDLIIANLADAAVWPTDPAKWERFACQAAGRDMTREEWNDVLPDRPYQHVCPP